MSDQALDWLETEISAVSCWHHGTPSYEHDANWMKDHVLDLISKARRAAVRVDDVCRICGGSGFVDDGEITGSGGVDYENGPVQCVKDCPACATSGQKLTDWRGGDIAAGTFILKDGRWAEVPRDTSGAVVLFHQVGWPQGEPK